MLEFNNEYQAIPAHTQEALTNYVEHKRYPGGFLTAVLTNNLMGAVSKADNQNIAALPLIAKYVYNHLPATSWGSEEKLHKWCEDDFYSRITDYQGSEDGV